MDRFTEPLVASFPIGVDLHGAAADTASSELPEETISCAFFFFFSILLLTVDLLLAFLPTNLYFVAIFGGGYVCGRDYVSIWVIEILGVACQGCLRFARVGMRCWWKSDLGR